ncbi:MAG: TetR/AcrR family transcriptional regulator [Desulfomonilaceae bacterium]
MSKTNKLPQKILDVSIDLFATNGFNGTSIRDIGKAIGTTISNIYYHFGSKEGLLFAILERSSNGIVESLREVTQRDIEPLEKFRLLLKTHLGLILEVYNRESTILFLEEEHLARERKEFQLEVLNLYRKELETLKSLGYISYVNTAVLAFNILGVINWHTRWYRSDGRMSLEEIGDEMVRFVLHGALERQSETSVAPKP